MRGKNGEGPPKEMIETPKGFTFDRNMDNNILKYLTLFRKVRQHAAHGSVCVQRTARSCYLFCHFSIQFATTWRQRVFTFRRCTIITAAGFLHSVASIALSSLPSSVPQLQQPFS